MAVNGSWTCRKCRNSNYPDRQSCNRCKAPRGDSQWLCQCGCYVYLNKRMCVQCSSEADPSVPIVEEDVPPTKRPRTWDTANGGPGSNDPLAGLGLGSNPFNNATFNSSGSGNMGAAQGMPGFPGSNNMGSPAPGSNFGGKGAGHWYCSVCQYDNFETRTTCNKCKQGRAQVEGHRPAPGPPGFGKTSWRCQPCAYDNYGNRQFCNKCGKSQAECAVGGMVGMGQQQMQNNMGPPPMMLNWENFSNMGGAGAGPNSQNFMFQQQCPQMTIGQQCPQMTIGKDGQRMWICTECGNDNFEVRKTCNMCVTPMTGSVNSKGWICPVNNCGADNFADRMDCFKCAGSRFPIGRDPEKVLLKMKKFKEYQQLQFNMRTSTSNAQLNEALSRVLANAKPQQSPVPSQGSNPFTAGGATPSPSPMFQSHQSPASPSLHNLNSIAANGNPGNPHESPNAKPASDSTTAQAGAGTPAADGSSVLMVPHSFPFKHPKQKDWKCVNCSSLNNGSSRICRNPECRDLREESEWYCKRCYEWQSSVKFCGRCGNEKEQCEACPELEVLKHLGYNIESDIQTCEYALLLDAIAWVCKQRVGEGLDS